MNTEIRNTVLLSLAISLFLVTSLPVLHAQVRSSSNYQLQSDSINVGGGLSSSTNFVQQSTVGEIATGRSSSTNFSLQAGYQQMQEVYLSLAGGGDVIMDPDLPGITGGTSNGSTTFTVVTDSPAGYQLTIQAENDPAMQSSSGATIANYPTIGAVRDFVFTVGAGEAYFGFTPEGEDIISIYQDNGSSCNTGVSGTLDACWGRIRTTADTVSLGSGSNHPLGATTTLKFRVGIGSGGGVESGVYTATTTVTALPL